MIGPSLGQEENITANSRSYDDFHFGEEEEVPQENILILDANNGLSISDFNCENHPTRLEVVIVQGSWNESDDNTNLILTSDIFADLETVECNNGTNVTNILTEIGKNEQSLNREYIFENVVNSEDTVKDPLADDSSVQVNGQRLSEEYIFENVVKSEGIQKEQLVEEESLQENDENNLMWLLNYKLDSMFNVDDIDHDHNYRGNDCDQIGKFSSFKDTFQERSLGTKFYSGEAYNGKVRRGPKTSNLYRRSLPILNTTSCIYPSTSLLSGSVHSSNPGCNSILRKPPFTYTEMIEQALSESGELTVSGIYNWISEHFPFYKANDDRWKNSVRHNLSINPHFKKGSKARHGAGHLWTIATQEDRPRTASRKRRLEQFWAQTSCCYTGSSGRSSPTTLAVESITLPGNSIEMSGTEMDHRMDLTMQDLKNEDIQASMEENKENSEKSSFMPQVICPILYNGPKTHIVSLEQSAEEILSGVKREVEVQYLTPLKQKSATLATPITFPVHSKDSGDFLNPVSKTEVVEESGLYVLDDGGVASFVVADDNFSGGVISSIENGEVIVPDNLFGEDLTFQYQEMVSPQAAQQLHV